MQNLVLFDIDGTLFDPEKFGRLIRAEFTKILNIDEEELIRANADYYAKLSSSTDFNPRDISIHLGNRFKTDPGVLDKVFWENDDIYKGALYEDAVDVLKKLSQDKTLGIFSQGNNELQTRKLNACDIAQYFSRDNLFIYDTKLTDEAIALLPRDSTVIDNKHDVVLKIAPVVDTIWINRRTEDSDPQVRTIHNLTELLDN